MSPPNDPQVIFTHANHDLKNIWTKKGESKQVLAKGWTKDDGTRPLPVDMIWEKDVKIKLRDGVCLLGDIFRPANSKNDRIPAILPWSPYGKTGSGRQSLNMFPYRVGVPLISTSGLEKWEAPDPAEWCARGYAVVNVDARGAYESEGDIFIYGTQEGRDGYDTIEWIAEQEWSNGSVALAGNSWLGTTQWFIAAEQPPHLKAMAPWEGLGDYYRESICRGGIPDHAFWDALFTFFGGKNKREDVSAMVEKYPLWNKYWEDKKPKLNNINVPMYATASYSTGLHTEGSLRGYLLSATKDKWLRFHSTQEWHDLYMPENVEDLARFLDKYTKGADNGWESTPKIRLSLLGYNGPSVNNRPCSSYPPPDFKYRSLYLDPANGSLNKASVEEVSSVNYNSAARYGDDSECTFTYKFERYTELAGFSKLQVYMSTPDHTDMDVYVVVRKLDVDGQVVFHQNIPMESLPLGTTADDIPHENIWKYVGPHGRLRASHRAVSEEPGYSAAQRTLLSDAYVWHPHDREEKLNQDEVVKLDIMLWPTGMIFQENEAMSLAIMGHLPIVAEFEGLESKMQYFNIGRHIVHGGGDRRSALYVAMTD